MNKVYQLEDLSPIRIIEIIKHGENCKFLILRRDIEELVDTKMIPNYFVEIYIKILEPTNPDNFFSGKEVSIKATKILSIYNRTYKAGGVCFFRKVDFDYIELLLFFKHN